MFLLHVKYILAFDQWMLELTDLLKTQNPEMYFFFQEPRR